MRWLSRIIAMIKLNHINVWLEPSQCSLYNSRSSFITFRRRYGTCILKYYTGEAWQIRNKYSDDFSKSITHTSCSRLQSLRFVSVKKVETL